MNSWRPGGPRTRRPFDPTASATTATQTASGYRIDGVKDRVEAGDRAGALLVTANCDGTLRQFVVPADTAGVTVTPQRSLDMVKIYARSAVRRVEIGSDAVVGSAEQTPAIIERQRQVALILQCAELVGILDTVLGFTTQWLTDRHSFGRPLSSYQALKHRFANDKMCSRRPATPVRWPRWPGARPTPPNWSASRKPMWPGGPR